MGAETWIAIGKFIGAVFGYGSAGTGWYWVGVQVARIAVLAYASKALTPRSDLSQTAREKLITVRDPIYPQAFVYGQDMLSGPLINANVGGDDGEYLTYIVGLTGHEIDSVIEYKLDDETIPFSDITGGGDSGVLNGGKYDAVAEVSFQHGTSTQTEDTLASTAFGALWTTDHRLRGWSYMVWRFELVEDNTAFETGAPQNLKAVIKGKKVYDPRLDTTNGGSGPHRLADPTTWEWSANPALCLVDFLRDDTFGCQEDDARIDWPMVITAADVCEETVTVPSPVNSQDRYTCNVTFRSDERRGDVKDALLKSMMGRMVFSQGVWKIWAGEAITPDVTLTENNLAGEVVAQASATAKERYNRVRGKYIDPSRNYSAATYPEARSAAYETEDGGEVRPLIVDFLATNESFEAQRKSIIALKQSRQQRVVSFQGNMSCFPVQPGSVILLDVAEYGFSGEKFFVSEWSMGERGILLTLVEENDSAWADPLVGEYTSRTETGALVFNNQGVSAPDNLTAAYTIGGVILSWDNPPQTMFQNIEVWVSETNVRSNATLLATTQGDSYIDVQADIQRSRYYWIRAINEYGTASAWEPNLTTTTAIAFPLIGEQSMFEDPFIRQGSALWVLSAGASYVSGNGIDSTDTLRFNTTTSAVNAVTVKRRGPMAWDPMAFQGMTIEVRLRIQMINNGTGSSFSMTPFVRAVVSDEDGVSNIKRYTAVGGRSFNESDSTGVWYDTTQIISIDDEITETPPRFIQFELLFGINSFGPDFAIDFVDATVSPQVFNPQAAQAKTIGLVPDAASQTVGRVLKADGSWGLNPGAQSDGHFEFDTTTTSGDPGSGTVRFNNGTLASVTNLYINATDKDGLDSDTLLGFLDVGNRLYFEEDGDSSKAVVFEVSSALTDNTGWWTVPVTVVKSGTLPTNTGQLSMVSNFTPSAGGGGGGETKYKTADEAISVSNTTLQDDDHLTGFALDDDSYYKVEGFFNINVDTVTPDFKCQFIFTNTPQDSWFALTGSNDNGSALDGDHGQYSATLVLNFTVANGWGIHVSGFIRSNATTGGTVKLQWAKNSIAVGDTTTLKLGTWLTLTKMS